MPYIDPTHSLIKVLTEICETEILFTEAMHGAIVADAFRIPWVAIKTHSRILEFKWNDWLSTLDIPYKPFLIKRKSSVIDKSSALKYFDYQLVRTKMAFVLQRSKPNLSHLSKMHELEGKVSEQLEKLKNDISRNHIFC